MANAVNPLCAELMRCEARVWDALVRGDAAADRAALSDDFLGVYPSGFATRADHVAQLEAGPSVTRYQILDPRVLPLGTGFAVLSYRAVYTRMGRDTDEQMFVSSIWRRLDATGWVNVFSQDTPVDGSETHS